MSHTLEAIAWTLIHFCWQAAAIAILYSIAARVTARRSSHIRYVVALTALMAMLASAFITFAWQIAPGSESGMSRVAEIAAGDFPRMAEPGRAPAAMYFAISPAESERIPSYLFWIDTLWLLGVCGLAFRNLGGLWMIRRLRAEAARFDVPPELQSTFARLIAALGLRRDVLLRVSDAIAGPVTIGTLRTVVLLPLSALSGLAADEIEVVLAHELAHVRRADFVWNLLQTFVETLFFFHPAVWWISGRVRHERELCCDDLALEVCPNPVVYASALFHLEEQRSRQLHLAMALDGNQGRQTLRMRIARILGEPAAFSGQTQRRFSMAAVFAGAMVLLLSAPQVIASLRPQVVPAVASISRAVASVTTGAASPAARITASQPIAQAAAQKPAPEKKQPDSQTTPNEPKDTESTPNAGKAGSHETYIDRMKAAGYDVDLDKLIAMKIQGVTPEYARAMAQAGLGKPSADDLIACKIQGVSPEVLSQLKQQGFEVKSFQDAISYQIFKVTPEFVSEMKAAGFGDLDSKKLIALRVQGVTPEFARSVSQQFPGVTADDLIQAKIFHIDGGFIASVKQHGFRDLTLKKLVQIRISGVLDDESK
jgi:beta-lactamase regulating signal transducer with metallopeptidase domain